MARRTPEATVGYSNGDDGWYPQAASAYRDKRVFDHPSHGPTHKTIYEIMSQPTKKQGQAVVVAALKQATQELKAILVNEEQSPPGKISETTEQIAREVRFRPWQVVLNMGEDGQLMTQGEPESLLLPPLVSWNAHDTTLKRAALRPTRLSPLRGYASVPPTESNRLMYLRIGQKLRWQEGELPQDKPQSFGERLTGFLENFISSGSANPAPLASQAQCLR